MDSIVEASLKLLGLRGKDKVTSFDGVISSVCFDVYGCVQVCLTPPVNKEGKLNESYWFDVKRVEVSAERVMNPPAFASVKAGTEIGGDAKPASSAALAPY